MTDKEDMGENLITLILQINLDKVILSRYLIMDKSLNQPKESALDSPVPLIFSASPDVVLFRPESL